MDILLRVGEFGLKMPDVKVEHTQEEDWVDSVVPIAPYGLG